MTIFTDPPNYTIIVSSWVNSGICKQKLDNFYMKLMKEKSEEEKLMQTKFDPVKDYSSDGKRIKKKRN